MENNHIDHLLEEIGNDIPKVNHILSNKIYSKAIENKQNNFKSFFFKPIVASMTTALCMVLIFATVILFKSLSLFNPMNQGGSSNANSNYLPSLSPSESTTLNMDLHYAVYSNEYDVITVAANNKVNNQKIYLKSHQYEILSVQLNNGDCLIDEVYIDNELFYCVTFKNKNATIHYFDICFEKGTFNNLTTQELINFIVYVDNVNIEKGFGYEFKIDKIYSLSGAIR